MLWRRDDSVKFLPITDLFPKILNHSTAVNDFLVDSSFGLLMPLCKAVDDGSLDQLIRIAEQSRHLATCFVAWSKARLTKIVESNDFAL